MNLRVCLTLDSDTASASRLGTDESSRNEKQPASLRRQIVAQSKTVLVLWDAVLESV
jgi:hypothetical protein